MQLATYVPTYNYPLVNNFELFHQLYDTNQLLSLPEWPDDTDYSNFPHIDDLLATLSVDDIKEGQMHSVRVPVDRIYSSDQRDGGLDRARAVNSENGIKVCKDHLNEDFRGQMKGYRQSDAGSMFGFLRFTSPNDIIVLKTQGNNRLMMKLLANRGQNSEVLMNVVFHNPNASEDDMLAAEGANHYTDAEDRRKQNENDKFCAGIVAGRQDSLDALNFLREAGLNYRDIWQNRGIPEVGGVSVDKLISIGSLTGLTSGDGNGWFRKYGRSNLLAAANILSRVCKEITKETEFSSTALGVTALLYKSMTEYGYTTNNVNPLFTRDQIDTFVFEFFRMKNKPTDVDIFASPTSKKIPIYGVAELKASQVKNFAFIMGSVFWPWIRMYYTNIKGNTNSFGSTSGAAEYILKECNDRFLNKEMRKILDGDI
jgi:hypothetical protein